MEPGDGTGGVLIVTAAMDSGHLEVSREVAGGWTSPTSPDAGYAKGSIRRRGRGKSDDGTSCMAARRSDRCHRAPARRCLRPRRHFPVVATWQ